ENKTRRMLHAHTFRLAGHRIFDGLDRDVHHLADFHAAVSSIKIERERHIKRIENLRKRRHDDFKRHPAGLPAANLQQRLPLLLRRALIKHQAARAVALVNRLRPMRGETNSQAIQPHIAVSAALDAPCPYAFAKAHRRRRAEFTWAAVITIAGLDELRFEAPFGFGTHSSEELLRFA